jgi:hypothetical protein
MMYLHIFINHPHAYAPKYLICSLQVQVSDTLFENLTGGFKGILLETHILRALSFNTSLVHVELTLPATFNYWSGTCLYFTRESTSTSS